MHKVCILRNLRAKDMQNAGLSMRYVVVQGGTVDGRGHPHAHWLMLHMPLICTSPQAELTFAQTLNGTPHIQMHLADINQVSCATLNVVQVPRQVGSESTKNASHLHSPKMHPCFNCPT